MKLKGNLFLAGMMAWFGCLAGNAQIIYSNNFATGGATNIMGTAPTVANTFAGGLAAATWNDVLGTNDTGALLANGSDNTTLADSWLLPFYPQSGYIYTLTASLTFSGNPGSWVGLGFAQNDLMNVPSGDGRFADSGGSIGPTGYDWLILTESSGNVQYFTGPKANSPAIYNGTSFTGGPQTLNVQVLLNTTASLWSITAYVNGAQMGSTFTYTNALPFGAVGITQNTLGAPTAVQWNNLSLTAAGTGPVTNMVNSTVSFSTTNAGVPLNPAFNGLSYEKLNLVREIFNSNDVPLVKLFSLLGPAVLRVGGGTVDQTSWNGLSNLTAITTSQVDLFAGFVKALPTNWTVIYAINFSSNNAATCQAEAAYVQNALGSKLLGFEIGNEPDEYGGNGIRPSGFSVASFVAQWNPLANAIIANVPGEDLTGKNGWTMTGPASADHTNWTAPFAIDELNKISLLTQHYYRGNTAGPENMQYMLSMDTTLPNVVASMSLAASNNNDTFRFDENGSFTGGGFAGVSDAYGAALWALDFMFTVAQNGGQGINFHGGGLSPYSPLVDNGTNAVKVGPEFYALKLFTLLPPGNIVPATVTPVSNTNFTAYGVRQTNKTISALLNNKSATNAVSASINLGSYVTGAQLIELTGPSLYSTSGFTLGGAAINLNGSWSGGVQQVLAATNGQLTVSVPPASAILLNPVIASPAIAFTVNGNQLTLSWPTNYIGWLLESNSTGVASANWPFVPGSNNTNREQITIQSGQSNVFFRLALP